MSAFPNAPDTSEHRNDPPTRRFPSLGGTRGEGRRWDVLVLGRGLVAGVTAVGLRRLGLSVLLVEPEPAKGPRPAAPTIRRSPDLRALALSAGSMELLEALSALPARTRLTPIRRIDVCDATHRQTSPADIVPSPSRSHLVFLPSDVRADRFGSIVMAEDLRRSVEGLVERWRRERGLDVLRGMGVLRAYSEGNVARVEVGSGGKRRSLAGSLVVSAEGAVSVARRDAGIGLIGGDFAQGGLVTVLPHAHDHGGVARETFFADGPFAVLPTTGRSSGIVWAAPRSTLDQVVSRPPGVFGDILADRMPEVLGEIDRQGILPPVVHPLRWYLAKTLTGPRLVLLGGSAHLIHPLAGQGLNLGLRDAAVLWDVMAHRIGLGLDLGGEDGLRTYRSERLPDIGALLGITGALKGLFDLRWPTLRLLRVAGMFGVGVCSPARRALIRGAMFGPHAALRR